MKILLVMILLAALAGGGYVYWQQTGEPQTAYRTAPVTRGDLLSTISATGTVEPVEVVDVGAQVAGKIREFGDDPHNPGGTIDYGTNVEEGTVLARIDDALYAADLARADAEVEQARANVWRAEADLEQMKAKLLQAENNWKRAKDVGSSGALSASDFDSYAAIYETAKATLAVGRATVVQAEKGVLQSQANRTRAVTNLEYCTIKSPVKGVIIDRRVNIGQTVVASLNAPSLFLIAKDLSKMQVWAAVNEADIGTVHAGQGVGFTVDAFPGESFRGEVGKIRLNASITQNVVTYTVEVNTDNSQRKLLPYLTANLRFEVDRRENVLLVPNAALRWTPSAEQLAPETKDEGPDSAPARGADAGRTRSAATSPAAGTSTGTVWVQDGPYVRGIDVAVGLSDGAQTAVEGKELAEGALVVVGEIEAGSAQQQTNNPFAPKFIRSRRPR